MPQAPRASTMIAATENRRIRPTPHTRPLGGCQWCGAAERIA
jgi:hypothetical protein